jgi:hypothetical protein
MHPDDQLMLRASLPHRAEFYPLGFAVQVASNSSAVLDLAADTWNGWTRAFDRPPLDIRVIVHLDGPVPDRDPVYRAQKNLFTIIADSANFAIADVEAGYCFVCVTPAVASSVYFRNNMLETMTYFTLDYRYLTLLHAGCVAREGRGVLLCGEAGAGKSCLVYACAKRGWTLLSDDFAALLREPGSNIVIGRPQRLRFRPPALELFPELKNFKSSITPFGKHLFDLRTGAIPNLQTARCCQAERIVFLDRRESGEAELVAMGPAAALAQFEYDRPYWDPPVFNEHREVMMSLLSRGVHTLRYSNFDDAIHILESLVA